MNGRPVKPLIHVDESLCGPAMRSLNPAHRAFVVCKVYFGVSNTEAARRAGYTTNPDSLRVIAHSVAHHPAVQRALLEEGQALMRSEGPKSIHALVQIRDDKKNPARDRLKAATELLSRSGFSALTEHHLTVEHHLTDAERDRRILELCGELGIAPAEARKMLVAPSKAIEAEFRVLEPARPLTPAEERKAAKNKSERDARARRKGMTPEELEADKARIRQELSDFRKRNLAAAIAARAAATGTETIDEESEL